jgi:hypothetical protein
MFWAKRRCSYADYAPYQDMLQKLMMANPAEYEQFLMVSVKAGSPGVSDYYIGVPHERMLDQFQGLEKINEADLPKQIDAFHLGDATKDPFQSRFKFEGRPR